MRFLFAILSLLAAARGLHCQTLRIYSEFQRVDPYGEILAIDRARRPREILSPAVARNAFASFRIAVTAPQKTNYFLYVLTNPEDQFRMQLYKERYARSGDSWIPDALEPTRLPCFGVMPDAEAGIPGQTTRVYLLDVWVPPDTLVRRVRLEVLLETAGWIVAPMEVRVVAARVPDLRLPTGAAASIEQRADAAAWGPLASYLFENPAAHVHAQPEPPLTLRDIIRRNAAQDMALARSIEAERHPQAASLAAMLVANEEIVTSWLGNPAFPEEPYWNPRGAEWYLRIRDFLLRYVP